MKKKTYLEKTKEVWIQDYEMFKATPYRIVWACFGLGALNGLLFSMAAISTACLGDYKYPTGTQWVFASTNGCDDLRDHAIYYVSTNLALNQQP